MGLITKNNSTKGLYQTYLKQLNLLQKAISTGDFSKWSQRKINFKVCRINNLIQKLRYRGYKLAAISSILLSSVYSPGLTAQVTGLEPCSSNPLEMISVNPELELPLFTTGDLNGDDLDDLILFSNPKDSDYGVSYFENSESGLTELTGDSNPFNDLDYLPTLLPSIGDLDGDGMNDILLFATTKDPDTDDSGSDTDDSGSNTNELTGNTLELYYYKNTDGTFSEEVLDIDVEDDFLFSYNNIFCDVDGDGDEDLLMFSFTGKDEETLECCLFNIDCDSSIDCELDLLSNFEMIVLENDGGVFTQNTSMANAYSNLSRETKANLPFLKQVKELVDDMRGKSMSAIISEMGNMPNSLMSTLEPSNLILPFVSCVDIDGDDADDLLVYDINPESVDSEMSPFEFKYFRNESGNFVQKTGSDNPFEDVSLGNNSIIPVIGDIDGDGMMNLYTSQKDSENMTSFECSTLIPSAAAIPTLGQWGIYLLSLCLMILGAVKFRSTTVSAVAK